MHICKVEDDLGHVCSLPVSNKQWKQDSMCSRCADGLWEAFYKPWSCGLEFKYFLHKEANYANIPPKSIIC